MATRNPRREKRTLVSVGTLQLSARIASMPTPTTNEPALRQRPMSAEAPRPASALKNTEAIIELSDGTRKPSNPGTQR